MKSIEERSKYFIGNNGDQLAEQLYFTFAEAQIEKHPYIDFMDENGKYIVTYKLVGNYYTDDF